jgi:hypothetical protein
MEYNYQGRTLPHLPVCLDFKDGKLYPNQRPGLGVELDYKQLTQIAEITEPVTARAQTYFRPGWFHHQLVDGVILNRQPGCNACKQRRTSGMKMPARPFC